jgi:hypothetical protein
MNNRTQLVVVDPRVDPDPGTPAGVFLLKAG